MIGDVLNDYHLSTAFAKSRRASLDALRRFAGLEYDGHRPHCGLAYMTPVVFAASCNPPGSATLRLPDCKIENMDNSLIKGGT
ncbi:MAG: hypothetical protein PVJ86_06015 [Phycisphaerales bacterium]|jgi:hypothetical protein